MQPDARFSEVARRSGIAERVLFRVEAGDNARGCTWLRDVLQCMTDGHPANRLDELLPWNWQPMNAKP
jgi:hypothetical protein